MLVSSALAGANPFGATNAASEVSLPKASRAEATSGCTPTPLILASITDMKGCGGLYTYNIPNNGGIQEFPVPPTGFQPLTATAAQLAEYDFPPMPGTSQPQALQQWKTQMAAYKSTPTPDPIQGCGSPDALTKPGTPSLLGTISNALFSIIDEGTYSGYDVSDSADTSHYVAVQGDFVQPSWRVPICRSTPYVSKSHFRIPWPYLACLNF